MAVQLEQQGMKAIVIRVTVDKQSNSEDDIEEEHTQ